VLKRIRAVVAGRAGIAIAATGSLVLLYLAIPRTVPGILEFPERQVLDDLHDGQELKATALKTLVDSLHRTTVWGNSGHVWSDLALAHLLLADDDDLSANDNVVLLEQAKAFLETSLRLAPTNPHDWARRAHVELLLEGPSPIAASALVMSILTGRYETDLMFARLQLCFISWQYFSQDDQNLVFQQIRIAWQNSPDQALEVAQREDGIDILRAAFASNPEALADLEERIAEQE
jgi:hypothetical protein